MSIEEMRSRGINPVARQLQAATPVWENANYAKFYSLLKQLPGDKEDIKRQLVLQYTCYRTDSLREVTKNEYYKICDRMRDLIREGGLDNAAREELRHKRSICLKLMQKLGIDTTCWNRINAFCQDGRIAGKPFRDISTEELDALARKLRGIERKGGLRHIEDPEAFAKIVNINR